MADEGWSVVGVLDRPLARRLLGGVDEVASRSPEAGTAGQLHQLSGLAQHPDLAAVVDWPPLLALAVELLSPNVYVNHSHLDVHPPHPPTGAHRWHRDNGLMGRDNLGRRIRRAMFVAYSYRCLTSRDTPFENVPEWAGLPRIRRQLLGDRTVDPFYWASGELPLDPRSTGLEEAA